MTSTDSFFDERCYELGVRGQVAGIGFGMPSRRRFIPYAWLLHAELNEAQTELSLDYTHSVVTITGAHLIYVMEYMEDFTLRYVREFVPPPPAKGKYQPSSVTRIEIREKE